VQQRRQQGGVTDRLKSAFYDHDVDGDGIVRSDCAMTGSLGPASLGFRDLMIAAAMAGNSVFV